MLASPRVNGTIFVVLMRADVPRMVRELEMLAVPVAPLRLIRAVDVAVVDWPPPVVLPRRIDRSTVG